MDFQFYHAPQPRHQSSFAKLKREEMGGPAQVVLCYFINLPELFRKEPWGWGLATSTPPRWPVATQLGSERSEQGTKPRAISFVLRLATVPQHCANTGVKPGDQSWPERSQPAVHSAAPDRAVCNSNGEKHPGGFPWEQGAEESPKGQCRSHTPRETSVSELLCRGWSFTLHMQEQGQGEEIGMPKAGRKPGDTG